MSYNYDFKTSHFLKNSSMLFRLILKIFNMLRQQIWFIFTFSPIILNSQFVMHRGPDILAHGGWDFRCVTVKSSDVLWIAIAILVAVRIMNKQVAFSRQWSSPERESLWCCGQRSRREDSRWVLLIKV